MQVRGGIIMARNFQEVMQIAKERGPKTISVACAQDAGFIGVNDPAGKLGDKGVEEIANKEDIDLAQFKIIDIKI